MYKWRPPNLPVPFSRPRESRQITTKPTTYHDTRASYYTLLNSHKDSEHKLNVIERYEEMLSLCSDDLIPCASDESPVSSVIQSREGLYILKQVCPPKPTSMTDILPCIPSEILESNAESPKHSSHSTFKLKKNRNMQVGTPATNSLLNHNCNTQTDVHSQSQMVQVSNDTKPQGIQTCDEKSFEEKLVCTSEISIQPGKDGFTQTYELITENDLLCMEWIDKNLFRVPMNPHTIIVDKQKRASSELTCLSTSVFQQELIWEGQALELY